MKNNLLRLAGFLSLLFFSCEKWDYDTREFPEVLTTSIDAGSFNRTVANGRVLGLERGTLEQVGHCWSNQNTVLTLAQTHTSLPGSAVAPDGSFESVLEGLSADTVYFLRAYAIYISLGRRDTVYETAFKNFSPALLNILSTSIRLEDVNVRITSAISGLAQNPATAFGHCWSNQTQTPRVGDGLSQHSDFGILDRDSVFEDYLPDLTLAQTYHVRAYAIVNGRPIYGNTLTVYVGDKWEARMNFPTTLYEAVGFCLKEKIYIGLGDNAYPSIGFDPRFWRYDPVTNYWTQIANYPDQPRFKSVSFVVGDKAYVGLGSVYNDLISGKFYAYDANSNSWTEKASFPGALRDEASAFSINNRGYISCGKSISNSPDSTYLIGTKLKDTWCYYPSDLSNGLDVNGEPMGRWVKKVDFAGTKRLSAVAFAINSSGYIGCGEGFGSGGFNDFWEFKPDELTNGLDEIGQPNGAWVRRADAGPFPRVNAVGFSIGNFGYIGGGSQGPVVEFSSGYTDWWRYDPSTDKWTAINIIPDGRNVIGTAVSNTNRGFVYRASYDIVSNFWEYTPSQ